MILEQIFIWLSLALFHRYFTDDLHLAEPQNFCPCRNNPVFKTGGVSNDNRGIQISELVGTEILLGNIVNTNSAYLSEKCAELGLSVYYQTVVGDNETRMRNHSDSTGPFGCRNSHRRSRTDRDDLTKEVTADVMGMKLVEDLHSKELMEEYLKKYKKNNPQRKITTNNYKQAMVPKGAPFWIIIMVQHRD